MQTVSRVAFLVRVNWNHSVLGRFAQDSVLILRLILRQGGWKLCFYATAFLGIFKLSTSFFSGRDLSPVEITTASLFFAAVVPVVPLTFIVLYRDVLRIAKRGEGDVADLRDEEQEPSS